MFFICEALMPILSEIELNISTLATPDGCAVCILDSFWADCFSRIWQGWQNEVIGIGLDACRYLRIDILDHPIDGLDWAMPSQNFLGSVPNLGFNQSNQCKVLIQRAALSKAWGCQSFTHHSSRTGQKPRHAHTFRAFLDIFQQVTRWEMWEMWG